MTRLRLFGGGAVAATILAGVVGSAAGFSLDSPNIGAGDDTVGTCVSSASTEYTTAFIDGSYKITEVKVLVAGQAPVTAECPEFANDGKTFSLTLTGTGPSVPATFTGTLVGFGSLSSSATVTLAAPVPVEDLLDAHLLVNN
ncbi:MAG: hypothetical protein ACKVT1_11265 [Dehalococcoidia bacterium]